MLRWLDGRRPRCPEGRSPALGSGRSGTDDCFQSLSEEHVVHLERIAPGKTLHNFGGPVQLIRTMAPILEPGDCSLQSSW